jgi:hypothetical protein
MQCPLTCAAGASPFYQTPNSPIARGLDLHTSDYIRARLTAMAIETPAFTREDVYTLFVTTRILNFLKGLPLSCSTDLAALLEYFWPDHRTRIGFTLLQRLAETRTLYCWTKSGLIANTKFKVDLFARVLQDASYIIGQNGMAITVGEWL